MLGFLRKYCANIYKKNRENYCLSASLNNAILSENDISPINVVYDIGANKGEWSISTNKILFNSDFYLFEANPDMEPALKKTKLRYFISALSDQAREATFFSKNGTGDSLYIEKTWSHGFEKKIVQTSTLDEIAKQNHIPKPDFVKLDTQGSEIDIITGGMEFISNARLILCEIPLIEYNSGAPDIGGYLKAFEKINFFPIVLSEIHRKSGQIVQIDMLFKKIIK